MICNISTWMNQWTLKNKLYEISSTTNATNVGYVQILYTIIFLQKQFTKTLFLQPFSPHYSNTINIHFIQPRCMLLVVISREPRCFTSCNRCKALPHGALLSTLHRCTRFGRKPWSSCSNLLWTTAWHGTIIGWWNSNPRKKNVWIFVGRYHVSTVEDEIILVPRQLTCMPRLNITNWLLSPNIYQRDTL